jgi:hypothetical protein
VVGVCVGGGGGGGVEWSENGLSEGGGDGVCKDEFVGMGGCSCAWVEYMHVNMNMPWMAHRRLLHWSALTHNTHKLPYY